MGRALKKMLALTLPLLLAACAALTERAPLPKALLGEAKPYGITAPNIRFWGDRLSEADLARFEEAAIASIRAKFGARIKRGERIIDNTLVLSGGGPDGAFGAGLLRGWTERGDRPEFALVTGVSTGAIIAVFAFLGPEYDAALEEIYTSYSTDDLIDTTFFSGLTGGAALADVSGFRALIDKYIDEQTLQRIAEEHRKGRGLFIGTTNIDASRPVIWNLGEIAASGHPRSLDLMRDVIQASSSIPAVFPPVIIPVEASGRHFDEMHVDGGATRQVAVFSPQISARTLDKKLGALFDRRTHVIINNSLSKPYSPVDARVLPVAIRALGGLISGSGDGDLYRIFALAQRDGYKVRVVSVPDSFTLESRESFDPAYMRALYDLGRDAGKTGNLWRSRPPDFLPAE
ncbi:MAG: patatin-like phospholipase family protein [Neomegalonema sp.]|nr:patatin-like phospholipase family protein [Neomegalonema sp.]